MCIWLHKSFCFIVRKWPYWLYSPVFKYFSSDNLWYISAQPFFYILWLWYLYIKASGFKYRLIFIEVKAVTFWGQTRPLLGIVLEFHRSFETLPVKRDANWRDMYIVFHRENFSVHTVSPPLPSTFFIFIRSAQAGTAQVEFSKVIVEQGLKSLLLRFLILMNCFVFRKYLPCDCAPGVHVLSNR